MDRKLIILFLRGFIKEELKISCEGRAALYVSNGLDISVCNVM
jgi:hypothetical protein